MRSRRPAHDKPSSLVAINASSVDKNLMDWDAVMTIWERGIFNLKLKFSEDYPNKAPDVRFVTNVFHPNGKRI